MSGPAFSVILLPTNACNVACDYCFERKTPHVVTAEGLAEITAQILDYMAARGVDEAEVYWQGGEAMLLGPEWYERAYVLMGDAASAQGVTLRHFLQSNMIGYSEKWNPILRTMFGNSVGTSMDYPNLHRKLRNGSAQGYTRVWTRNVELARRSGLDVSVIAVLHAESLAAGAGAFYSYFADELGLRDFQVNTPFPGGPARDAWQEGELDHGALTRFLVDLMNIWLERGRGDGVRLGPFDALIDYFSGRDARLPCIWTENCADQFVSIDAKGDVALCDCWVTSYPDYAFGSLSSGESLVQIVKRSTARKQFLGRPARLVEEDACLACEFLAVCHGGCPVRAIAWTGDAFAKDPFCQVYKGLFAHARRVAVQRHTASL